VEGDTAAPDPLRGRHVLKLSVRNRMWVLKWQWVKGTSAMAEGKIVSTYSIYEVSEVGLFCIGGSEVLEQVACGEGRKSCCV
jgi:hypothetical protein